MTRTCGFLPSLCYLYYPHGLCSLPFSSLECSEILCWIPVAFNVSFCYWVMNQILHVAKFLLIVKFSDIFILWILTLYWHPREEYKKVYTSWISKRTKRQDSIIWKGLQQYLCISFVIFSCKKCILVAPKLSQLFSWKLRLVKKF